MKGKIQVKFMSDFRNVNRKLKRMPYPITKVSEIPFKLEGFKYDTQLDLNMGYFHIIIIEYESNLFTIILLWGKYCYKMLPMGDISPPIVFHHKLNVMSQRFEFTQY